MTAVRSTGTDWERDSREGDDNRAASTGQYVVMCYCGEGDDGDGETIFNR